ncbi:MAG: mannosyltransferase [Flavobacteriaceae bacterium]|nr:MAG: mannosyltransferase [Flavobacteriaceae bacterium]
MVLGSLAFYVSFAYDLDRTDFIKLVALFVALFFLHYKLIQFEKWNLKFLLVTGILFRLVFLITLPNLSQDFYRFIWDGELVSNGINPYLQLPNTLIEQEGLIIRNATELYTGMGNLSAKHYSNYPPLNQLIFAISSLLGGKSILGAVVIMRSIIILADIGVLYFGRKLLQNLNRSPHLIFWYFLNPLIIIELTGNLHFEGVMLFFFVWAMYLLSIKKWVSAAIIYAFSISLKLVPLLFLPLFLNYFGLKKSILFYLTVGGTLLLMLLPFYSPEFISNYSETIGLWFSNFEFNASLYNVAKKIAILFDVKPWEFIKDVGKISPYITIGIVLLFTFLRNNKKLSSLITAMLWVLAIYYFISTTVHPWYPIFLVLLSVFTNYKFPLLWSLTIILSYWAYSNPDYNEHLGLLFIEYSVVFGYMLYEILKNKGNNVIFLKN